MKLNLLKRIRAVICFMIIVTVFIIFIDLGSVTITNPPLTLEKQPLSSINNRTKTIVLVTVSCLNRFEETVTMIFSSLVHLKATSKLQLILFTERNLMNSFEKVLNDMVLMKQNFNYLIYEVAFPKKNNQEWKGLFKECASERLFFANLLPQYDAILYVDSDVLFVSFIENIWHYFSKMNSSQMLAMSLENENSSTKGWYKLYAKHPSIGVNSGVILMNLTKMRQFRWNYYIMDIFHNFKNVIRWGDQDIINILLYYYPSKLLILPCSYNFRPECCRSTSKSKYIKILHGSRNYFHTNNTHFSRVYDEFYELKSYHNDSLSINNASRIRIINMLSAICE